MNDASAPPPAPPAEDAAPPASTTPASATPPAAPPPDPVPPSQQVPLSQQGVPSTPYRGPLELALVTPRVSPVLTVWGPVLILFGAGLWSFVVAGQLVTSYAPGKHGMLLGEGTGVLFVLAATGVAWFFALRRSLVASPAGSWGGRIARGIIVGMLAATSSCATTMGATIVGKNASKDADGTITVMLLALAVAAFVFGRRLTHGSTTTGAEDGSRALKRAAWIAAALLTLFALAELAADS